MYKLTNIYNNIKNIVPSDKLLIEIFRGFLCLTLKALKYFRINHGDQSGLFQFELFLNVSACSFSFI